MTFLTPMVGIVAASVAVPAVLLFYFLKLRRRPVRVSTVRFWQASADDLQVNAPFRMLRPSWLLLLHLLITGLLCVAAARPALDKGSLSGGRVVIVLDHSASMAALDAPARGDGGDFAGAGGGAGEDSGNGLLAVSRLEMAKREAARVVDGLDAAGAQGMVVSMASRAVVRANLTRDAGALKRAIEGVEQTDQPADLGEALRLALAFARSESEGEGGGSSEAPTVVLVTDGAVGLEPGSGLTGLGSVTVRLVRAGPAPGSEPGNVGIVAISARRDFQDPALIRVFARVQSTVREAVSVGVTCGFDGVTAGAGVIEMNAAGADAVVEASRTFEVRSVTGGVVTVTLARRDTLESDNQASLVVTGARPPRILLVRPGDESGGVGEGAGGVAGGAAENLRAALETLQPSGFRVVSAGVYARESAAGAAVLVGGERADLIVFDRVRPGELPAGVASMSFGAGLPIEGLRVTEGEPSPGGFSQWDRSHPVMRFVSLADVALDSVGEVVTAGLAGGTTATTLAWARRGPAVVLLESGGVRRIVAALDLSLTTWSKDVSFPTFIANAVDHLTLRGEENAARWWRTSEAVTLPARAEGSGGAPGAFGVTGPRGWSSEAMRSDDGAALVGVLPRAGLYRVAMGDGGVPVAVNLMDAWESQARVRESVDLGGQTATAEGGGRVGAVEVWEWFVLGALGLLCVEWLLFAWRSRV